MGEIFSFKINSRTCAAVFILLTRLPKKGKNWLRLESTVFKYILTFNEIDYCRSHHILVCAALPNRFARYDQPSSSTHTNSTHEANNEDFDGGGDGTIGDDKFNNTLHLLDFLSQLIINADAANNNSSMKLTFEETMTGLDAIISQLDQELQNKYQNVKDTQQLKRPRLDDDDHQALVNGKNDAEKYQALLELKDILDQQFKEFSIKANDETKGDYVNPHQDDTLNEGDFYVENTSTISLKDTSNALSDEERLKIPLVGVPNANLSQISLNEDTLNLLVKQDSNNPGVAIFPMSEQDKIKEDLSTLTGIDLDDLIKDVSESVGQVSMPVKVEESFVTVAMSNDQNENNNRTADTMVGKRPYYKYTETIADVTPNHSNPRDPQVNILSKRFEEGDLLSTDPKQNYRWGPNPGITKDGHQMITHISKFGPNLEEIAQSVSDGSEDNVKVNVTTKTNIVNVFTFNIFVNNGTKDKDGTVTRSVLNEYYKARSIKPVDQRPKPED